MGDRESAVFGDDEGNATKKRGNVEFAEGRDRVALPTSRLTSLEICAGAGGLALGLERAGFDPVLLLDNRPIACETLRANRPGWDVREIDLTAFDPFEDQQVYDVHLLSGASLG
ncbi:DNA cytosine methyltransferase [Streptomyces sp. SUK 48]|uniref:DNA cytosine methyltransferase n=1 Tax=Streptomyces sp. SUK 48 TaxID=2582831 RepID=UPI0031B9FF3E